MGLGSPRSKQQHSQSPGKPAASSTHAGGGSHCHAHMDIPGACCCIRIYFQRAFLFLHRLLYRGDYLLWHLSRAHHSSGCADHCSLNHRRPATLLLLLVHAETEHEGEGIIISDTEGEYLQLRLWFRPQSLVSLKPCVYNTTPQRSAAHLQSMRKCYSVTKLNCKFFAGFSHSW